MDTQQLYVDRLTTLPKLGVGISFQAALRPFVIEHADAFDFVEIMPDTLWEDHGIGLFHRYKENSETHTFLMQLASSKPIVGHSVGLSIGSAERFDTEHVAQIAKWQQLYRFPWHSDHLAFSRLEHASGHSLDVGITMPTPYDEAVLNMIAERIEYVQRTVPVPFLLENNVYYFEIPEQDMTEAVFLNKLTDRTNCGLILDIHNVYVNARNHGFDPWSFFGDLDLARIVEIHLAGGMELEGFYLDAHSGPCPQPVWSMLEAILPQAPNVGGIVFELLGSYYPEMGADLLRHELDHAREIWQRHR
jgi:uncharacterized protein (UPF0276 family)